MTRPARYFTAAGTTPRPELFDREAQEEAQGWLAIKPSQLRRFYGQTMADRRRLELKGPAAEDDEARVAMALLKAGAAYAAAREKTRNPLADFLAHHAGLVRTVADFRAFARHFEAVVAWHTVFTKTGGADTPGGAARGERGGPLSGAGPKANPIARR